MSELKPCPFCGGEARTMEQHRWWVFCPECMCDLGFEGMDEGGCYGHYDTEAEAVEAWNTRHNPEEDALPMTDENMAAHGWKRIETCKVVGSYYSELMDVCVFSFSCRDSIWWNDVEPPNYCPECGRKVER